MNGSEDLIPLLYRADWTRWSVSASVVVRWSRSLTTPYRAQATSRLLIAPAGRYRYEPVGGRGIPGLADEDQVTLIVCDGHSCWVIRGRGRNRLLR